MVLLLLVVGALMPTLPAIAACPQSLADCLGAADALSIVADRVVLSRGAMAMEGYVAVDGSEIQGDTCAMRGSFAGPNGCFTETENLILAAADGIAAKFAAFNSPSCTVGTQVGVRVTGDVVTGGGLLGNTNAVTVSGVTDTTGADGRVATCAQALTDMHAAAATFAALVPTRDLGRVRHIGSADGPDGGVATADPGVNVWTADSISVFSRRGPFGEIYDSYWGIALDPATESVIINVKRVTVGTFSTIYVSGGDPRKVVLNVLGKGSFRTKGFIDPRIVAAQGKVTATYSSYIYGGALGGTVMIFAGTVY